MLFLELFLELRFLTIYPNHLVPLPQLARKHGTTDEQRICVCSYVVHALKDKGLTSLSVTCFSRCPCF